jgi:DNA-directed RNA polymerase sigma subunit (sigma70/sigma32)
MTLEECATVLGCTRERVRQIEKKALMKLKKKLAALDIKEYKDISVDTHGTSDTFNPQID